MSAAPIIIPERASRRLDQWLWFARFAKTRSLAARLCVSGMVTVNGAIATKANQTVRVGDTIVVTRGGWQRTIRVVALGSRRGPPTEAAALHDEVGTTRLPAPEWEPLLAEGDVEP